MTEASQHLDNEVNNSFAAKAIYGLITVQAVLVAMHEHPPTAWHGAIILFGTTLVIALVENYAEIVSHVIGTGQYPTRVERRSIWYHVRPVLVGAQAPTLLMLLSALGVFSVDWAITIAEVSIVLFLFGFGIRVGQLLHQHWLRQILSGLGLVLISSLLVALKALLH